MTNNAHPDGSHAIAPQREFLFTENDFERICKLIHDKAGIVLTPIKQNMVYNRLSRRLRAKNCASFSEYLSIIEGQDNDEMEIFVNSLTTHLTAFFREPHHFDVLSHHMKRMMDQEQRLLRIWCAASATGEEPYSLAITACETFCTLTPPVFIMASDIDTSGLTMAQDGIYLESRLGKMSTERLSRFFIKPDNTPPDSLVIRPELRNLVHFVHLNLRDEYWPDVPGPFDAIFCRNVMIYFDKPTQHRTLRNFVPLLRQDGLLFTGHSEIALPPDLFRPLGRTVHAHADKS